MGGERASTTRQRLAGKICCWCRQPVDLGFWPGGERACDRCANTRSNVVYMTFERRDDRWQLCFEDGATMRQIGRPRRLSSDDQLREMIERTPTKMDLAAHQAVDHGISSGKGGVYLTLTAEQLGKLG